MNDTGYIKMNRDEWVTYLDTQPDSDAKYEILGVGITEFATEYNPSVESEKWIIERTSRHIHESNEKTGSVSQSIYVNDPCYKFIEAGRGKLNYRTKILDIDMTRKSEDGSKYYAELSEGLVAVTSHMGENATIEYDLYYEGDPQIGYVTMEEKKPTFTAGDYAAKIMGFAKMPINTKDINTKETKEN